MQRKLRMLAVAVAALSLVLWLAGGANTGWTKNSETKWIKDPVTEIDGPVIVPRFVPGVELLGAALSGAVVLLGLSFVRFRKRRS